MRRCFTLLLISISQLSLSKISTQNVKKAPRIACHEEYDFLQEKTFSVCGKWTVYPDTNYAISRTSKIFTDWISKVYYGNEKYRYTDAKKKITRDYFFPYSIDEYSMRSNLRYITDWSYANSVEVKYTTTTSSKNSTGVSINLGKIGSSFNSIFGKLSISLPSINLSLNVESYTEKSVSITYKYSNPGVNQQFRIGIVDTYIPIKVLDYKVFSPGSYVEKEDYVFYKVSTSDIVFTRDYFLDPWGKRGKIFYTDLPYSLKNDIVPISEALFN